MPALPVSVLLLARDEAERLDVLLPALAFARDVVVVVDGARPATVEVARRHGARVFERPLTDFGEQRQFALGQCREPWVLWLDADERLDGEAVAGVTAALTGTPAHDGYRLERATWFLGRRIRFCGWRGERILRLFRRDRAHFDPAPVHETVTVRGSVGRLPGRIEHYSYESWGECRDKLVRYASAGARRARAAGRRAGPLDVAVRPPLRFLRMYVLQGGLLDGARGVAVCALGAAQVFLKYAELWLDDRR